MAQDNYKADRRRTRRRMQRFDDIEGGSHPSAARIDAPRRDVESLDRYVQRQPVRDAEITARKQARTAGAYRKVRRSNRRGERK